MSTIADVAARAGVSKATASRALSGRGYVSATTRRKVEKAAQELAYIGHASATSLATGRTRTVAVLLPPIHSWYFTQLLDGIGESLLAFDHDLLLYGNRADPDEHAKVFEQMLPRRRFDGIIAAGIQPGTHELERLLSLERPVVTIGSPSGRCSAISIDEDATARIATEHLIELGHEDIAFIGGSAHASTLAVGDAHRVEGYRRAMTAAGLSERIRHAPADPTMSGGYEAAADLLGDRRSRPTALVGVCDEAAIGATIAARRLGIAVPTELSVIGIDDHEHAGMFTLTTIRQNPRDQGREAVRLLRRHVENPGAPIEHVVAPSSLVVRNSTAVPRV